MGQRAGWAGLSLSPLQSRAKASPGSQSIEAVRREVFGYFLTKDEQELN